MKRLFYVGLTGLLSVVLIVSCGMDEADDSLQMDGGYDASKELGELSLPLTCSRPAFSCSGKYVVYCSIRATPFKGWEAKDKTPPIWPAWSNTEQEWVWPNASECMSYHVTEDAWPSPGMMQSTITFPNNTDWVRVQFRHNNPYTFGVSSYADLRGEGSTNFPSTLFWRYGSTCDSSPQPCCWAITSKTVSDSYQLDKYIRGKTANGISYTTKNGRQRRCDPSNYHAGFDAIKLEVKPATGVICGDGLCHINSENSKNCPQDC